MNFCKNNSVLLGIILASLFLVQCSPVYIPNVVNSPLLTEKGEMNLNLNLGVSGFDPQLAIAATEHIGFMANGSFNLHQQDTINYDYQKHNFFEAGVGYFGKLGKFGSAEFWCGYGVGRITSTYNDYYSNFYSSDYQRFFFQYDIGFKSDIFDASICPRVCFVNVTTNGLYNDYYFDGRYVPFFEPVMTFKLGYKYVKLTTQFGLSILLENSNHNSEQIYDYQPFIISVGLQINLNLLSNQSNNEKREF